MRLRSLLAAAALAAVAPAAGAQHVYVTSTLSGSAFNWTYDFTVHNLMPVDQNVYFFGVRIDNINRYSGAPSPWNNWAGGGISFNSGAFGGTGTSYNTNYWYNFDESAWVAPGETLSGFTAHVNTLTAVADVPWFAFTEGTQDYDGSDTVYPGPNPLFEGITNEETPVESPAPEPASIVLVASGIAAMAVARRRRR